MVISLQLSAAQRLCVNLFPCIFLFGLKEVDANENALRFWQEIYDGQGKLVETHEKFPVDKGHRKV